MKIIILDTETTGMAENDRICQLSYLVLDEDLNIEEIHNDLCLPPLPIGFEAMAIHHITPEMLENKPSCKKTKAYQRLCELNTQENLMIIQNAAFDLSMLAKEGFSFEMNLIDTFRILRALYAKDAPHSLQFKRYQWGLYKQEQALINKLGIEVKAHDALGDVIVLKHLFEKIAQEHSLPKMIILCSEPMILDYIPFGKHLGKRFLDVAKEARGDLHYMLNNLTALDDDMKASITHALDSTKEEAVITIGFGKHAGKTPQEVAKVDRNYLNWMITKAENINDELREAIMKALSPSK